MSKSYLCYFSRFSRIHSLPLFLLLIFPHSLAGLRIASLYPSILSKFPYFLLHKWFPQNSTFTTSFPISYASRQDFQSSDLQLCSSRPITPKAGHHSDPGAPHSLRSCCFLLPEHFPPFLCFYKIDLTFQDQERSCLLQESFPTALTYNFLIPELQTYLVSNQTQLRSSVFLILYQILLVFPNRLQIPCIRKEALYNIWITMLLKLKNSVKNLLNA